MNYPSSMSSVVNETEHETKVKYFMVMLFIALHQGSI